MSRRRPPVSSALIATIATLGAVPVLTGALGIIRGPAGAPGGAPTTASVDSEYRFVNTFWLGAGLALWWSLIRPRERAAATRATLTAASLGGIPRLISWGATGAPHPVFRGTIVLELLVVPAVLAWHAKELSA